MDKITHISGTFPLAVACQIREGWQGEKEENGIVREDNRIPVTGQFSVYDTDRLLKLWII